MAHIDNDIPKRNYNNDGTKNTEKEFEESEGVPNIYHTLSSPEDGNDNGDNHDLIPCPSNSQMDDFSQKMSEKQEFTRKMATEDHVDDKNGSCRLPKWGSKLNFIFTYIYGYTKDVLLYNLQSWECSKFDDIEDILGKIMIGTTKILPKFVWPILVLFFVIPTENILEAFASKVLPLVITLSKSILSINTISIVPIAYPEQRVLIENSSQKIFSWQSTEEIIPEIHPHLNTKLYSTYDYMRYELWNSYSNSRNW